MPFTSRHVQQKLKVSASLCYLSATSCSFSLQYAHTTHPPKCPTGHSVWSVLVSLSSPSCQTSRWQKGEETWHCLLVIWYRGGDWRGGGVVVFELVWRELRLSACLFQWVIHCKTEHTHTHTGRLCDIAKVQEGRGVLAQGRSMVDVWDEEAAG